MLRTEKAINDLACHPLPQSFYQGGLKQLRQRFDSASIASDSDASGDYFSASSSSSSSKSKKSSLFQDLKKTKSSTGSTGSRTSVTISPVATLKAHGSRSFVQAGDLLTTAGSLTETPKNMSRAASSSGTISAPTPQPQPLDLPTLKLTTDEFDLREEVMSCIAKSIGLLQPPLSGGDSVEASPAFPPSEGGPSSPRSQQAFRSSFGSLSLLDIGVDDASSSRTESSSSVHTDGYVSNLDNEVEILFFPAGSILAKAGERNTGEFRS